MKNLIYGVGINDADYKVRLCPFYRKWISMLTRCYSEKYHSKFPTYKNCTVCKEWLTFSNFKRWMKQQDWNGNQLDKDIINPGNKVYSPDNCCFISKELNYFLTNRRSKRGKYKIGVTGVRGERFIAECRDPFNKESSPHIGMFDSEESAHQDWLSKKDHLAKKYAALQSDERVSNSLLVLFSTNLYEKLV